MQWYGETFVPALRYLLLQLPFGINHRVDQWLNQQVIQDLWVIVCGQIHTQAAAIRRLKRIANMEVKEGGAGEAADSLGQKHTQQARQLAGLCMQ